MNTINASTDTASARRLELSAKVVSSFVSNNELPPERLPDLIKSVYQTMSELAEAQNLTDQDLKPAVPIAKSVTPDRLICLEDGKKLTMLKRYLRTQFDMSPEEYRARWSLPPDYPMVAPNYAKRRSDFAKQMGLGRNRK